jgi:hypothetical protein
MSGLVLLQCTALALSMEKTTKTKLLTVDDVFLIEGRGVIVTPTIPPNAYDGPPSRTVTLRFQDGRERTVKGEFQIHTLNRRPADYHYIFVLPGLAKDDVPIGTEVWLHSIS